MKKVVDIKVIRDDAKEFIFDRTLWGITYLDGFNGVNNEIFSDNNAIGDGSIFSGERVGDKDRTISAKLINKNLNEIMRKVAISFFNPKHTYKVYVAYQNQTMWCEGRQIGFSCPMGNIYRPIELTWTILSNMSYMMSVDNFGKDIASIKPMSAFPYLAKIGVGCIGGKYNFTQNVLIENDGDVDTFFQCIITAKGDVINPKIVKDDKYVRLIDTMIDGDVYVIDFVSSPPTVKKNGANAISKTDRTSSFTDMGLTVGDNDISFNADNGSSNMQVVLYYNKRYLGL